MLFLSFTGNFLKVIINKMKWNIVFIIITKIKSNVANKKNKK